MKKKIFIDGRCLSDTSTGIKRYTEQIIESYIHKYGQEQVFVLVMPHYKGQSAFQCIPFEKKAYSAWNFLVFGHFLKKLNADIYHFPCHYNSFFKPQNKIYITTMHDIMYRVVPNFYRKNTWLNKLGMIKTDFFIRRSLKNSDLVFSISECTQKDVYKSFGKASFVIQNGVNEISKASPKDSLIRALGLEPQNYFLYAGLTMHHKNVQFLIDTFLLLGDGKKLVICGHNNGQLSNSNPRILFPGFVDDATLASLYKFSSAFVYPSLYEGFGMPVLEALKLGAKVFSSHGGALKEFSPEIVRFFDPTQKAELLSLMQQVEEIEIDQDKVNTYLNLFDWKDKMGEMQTIIDNHIPS